jgi:hypothetical protein
MRSHRKTFLFTCLAMMAGMLIVSRVNAQQQGPRQDIWEDEVPAPQYPWWQKWLDDQTMDRIMKSIQQRDPAKAKELAELRQKNVEDFKEELVQQGRQEIDQISRERYEARVQKEQAEFVEWLKTNYPKEADALARIKEKDPALYVKSHDRLMTQYGSIFRATKSNAELAGILKEDLELKKKRDDLVQKIRQEKSQEAKDALGKQLRDVVSRRYDLIVRRKEMTYEQLQKRLEDLQKQLKDSRTEIGKWKDPGIKQKNVQQHIESLTDGKLAFKWD